MSTITTGNLVPVQTHFLPRDGAVPATGVAKINCFCVRPGSYGRVLTSTLVCMPTGHVFGSWQCCDIDTIRRMSIDFKLRVWHQIHYMFEGVKTDSLRYIFFLQHVIHCPRCAFSFHFILWIHVRTDTPDICETGCILLSLIVSLPPSFSASPKLRSLSLNIICSTIHSSALISGVVCTFS